MPLLRQVATNLLGGVSQQPPAVRSMDQCEKQENAWPSPAKGLIKRPPLEFIKKLTATAGGTARYHIVDRSPTEQYLFVIKTANIQAYTLVAVGTKAAGDSLTISDPGAIGYSYLSNTGGYTAFDTIRAHTVADYTFILNNQKTVALDAATTSAKPYSDEAYIFVRRGNYLTDYKIRIKSGGSDVTKVCMTWRGDGNPGPQFLQSIQTEDIADKLRTEILSAAIPNLTVTQKGSVLRLALSSGTFDVVEALDSIGDSTMSVVWKEVPRVAAYLPEICTHGFIVKIVGDGEIAADDYYVKFIADEGSGAFGRGKWQEDLNYSAQYKFDASTMPHALTRSFDGSGNPQFSWVRPSWEDKITGDNTLNPSPSFVGRKIQNLFFYKERLGVLCDDRIVMSETHEPLNFWRTTLLTLEDSSPIDVLLNHSPVALCKSATPYIENVVLQSARNQFILRGSEILSPRTVQITPVSAFENQEDLEPIMAGRGLFFGFKRGDHSGIREFFQQGDADSYDSGDVTIQAPNYVQGEIDFMTASTLEETLIVKGSTETNVLYVYKYYWNGDQKVLSSWGKWTFANGMDIRYAKFIENTLYVVSDHSDGLHLERIRLTTGLTDSGSTFLTLLDKRFDQTQASSIVYDGGTGRTTITFPYTVSGSLAATTLPQVVNKSTGAIYTYVSNTTTTVVVTGNLTAVNFWCGLVYPMTLGPTKPLVKLPAGRGVVPESAATQRVKHLELQYAAAGPLHVYVTNGNRATQTYTLNSTQYAHGAVVYDTGTLRTDKAKIAIHGRADDLLVEIVNFYPYPCQLTSAIWEILFYESGQRG